MPECCTSLLNSCSLKRRLDPQFRFRNVLWDTYYAPTLHPAPVAPQTKSDFQTVFSNATSRDAFYQFLQHIYHIYPEQKFHSLIKHGCSTLSSDRDVYGYIQQHLSSIKPVLSEISYGLPALKKQKQEMARQTLELLDAKVEINGYVEIGTTGRYISELKKHLSFRGPLVLLSDVPPSNSPIDIAERGQLKRIGTFVSLNNYAPIAPADIADNSIDVATCYIGLHHSEPHLLSHFLRSIWRILRPGGTFILRDHDVRTLTMHAFVSLAHAVFNAGLGQSWETNSQELRHFVSAEEWSRRLRSAGFRDTGKRLVQAHDPTDNVLMAFVKSETESQP